MYEKMLPTLYSRAGKSPPSKSQKHYSGADFIFACWKKPTEQKSKTLQCCRLYIRVLEKAHRTKVKNTTVVPTLYSRAGKSPPSKSQKHYSVADFIFACWKRPTEQKSKTLQ
jgi:hypothetical protein